MGGGLTEIILPNPLNCPFVPDIDGDTNARKFCIERYHPFRKVRPLVRNAVRTVVVDTQSEGLRAKVDHGDGSIKCLIIRQAEQAQDAWRLPCSLVAHTQT